MSLMKLTQKNTTRINPAQEAAAILKKIKAEIPVEQCFLFGSGASGNFHADSDLDMLLVFSDTENMRDVQKKIYSQRWSHLPIDFILKNKTEFDQRKIFGGVCFEAFHNGQEIF